VGLEVGTAKFVTVKNPMNYQLAYREIMKAAYILDTPGPTTPNLKSLAFTRLRRPYFPLDDDIPGLASRLREARARGHPEHLPLRHPGRDRQLAAEIQAGAVQADDALDGG
jgi:hypothetical protein